ncbi:hypothetical protein ABZP36_029406 [Zizania latifolia]
MVSRPAAGHSLHAELLTRLLRRGRLWDVRAVASRLGETVTDPAVSDALVACHSRLGDVAAALSHFQRLVQSGRAPSAASSNALFRSMCSASMYTEAMDLFVLWEDAPAPLPVSEFRLLIPGLCSKGAVDKARFLFDVMLGSGLTPPVRAYKSLVFAYCKARRSLHASEMCQMMVKKGMHLDRVLGTALIRRFCQDGRLEPALDVFHKMKQDEHVELDAYAYTTMIGGLFQHGYVDHGRELYLEMMKRGIEPDAETYNVMMKWYCKSNCTGGAMELYKVMIRTGVAPDLKCYTILMTSLCKDGKLGEAEHLFDKMLDSSLFPDHVMFISIAKFFPKGWPVVFMQKALKAVAKDCSGQLLELSSLAGGCSNMSLQEEADHLLDEMVKSNVLPVDTIFNLMIIAMCSEGRLDVTYYLLEKLVAYGCEPSVLTYNIVIKCLCKQKRMDDARTLISLMQSRAVRPDMSTNSIMVTAYCKIGDIDSALCLFDEMVKDGLEPSISVYDSIISCMCRIRRLKDAEFTLRQMIGSGLTPDEVIYTSLLNGYSIMGQSRNACRIFDEMLERCLQPGSHAYGALINGLIKENKIRKALSYLERMLEEGFATQTVIYTMLINQFLRKGDVRLGLDLVALMMKNYVEPDLITYGALITGICRNIDRRDMRPSLATKLKEARCMLFRMLPQITVDKRQGKQKDKHMSTEEKIHLAQIIIQDLADSGMMPDLHIYNGMLNGLCRAKKMDDAYNLLSVMDQSGVVPNHVTYTILMNNQIRLGDSNHAIKLFNSLNSGGYVFDKITYNTFIKGLSLAGRMKEALSFFLMMQKRGFVPSKASYDKLIEFLLAENAIDLVLQLFEDMFFNDYIPRYANYTSLLLILAKDGQWREADRIFMMMLKKGKYLDTETKKCLQELCYKQGELDLAFEMEGCMPIYAVG